MTDARRDAAPILWSLAIANFVVGMGAFVAIGLISPVGQSFDLDAAHAGFMMTVYAAVYAVGSPVLVALAGRQARERVILAGMALFTFGAALTSAAPTFDVLLVARAIAAIGAGLVTPVAASIGIALVAPERRGKALATVFGGLTLAQALGVPLGTWLGYRFGWHATFASVAVLSLGCLVWLWAKLPRGLVLPPTTLATLGEVLVRPRLVMAVGFTALFMGGIYVLYTYLAPFLEARLHLERDGVSALLLVFGLGAVVGNAVGGFLTDRLGSLRTLTLLSIAQIVSMPILSSLPLGLALSALVILVWSVFGWAFMVPQQARLAAMDGPRTPVLFALNAAAIYLGGAIGSAIGGQAFRHLGFSGLGWVGAAVIILGLASLFAVRRPPADAA